MTSDLGQAADLATVPEEQRPARTPGRRGVLADLRTGWLRLTSMRTALILLFLLALAAVPASYFPQRLLNPPRVAEEFARNPGRARVLDALGLYDVFSAWWFVAIYLLLFTSLVGCLVPRVRLHARSLRKRPPAPPRVLARLPRSTSVVTTASPEQAVATATRLLRRKRFRVERRAEPDGVLTVAAEKGYARETGNLVFHIALLLLLAGVAIGASFGYQGRVLVVEGETFANTPIAYDVLRPGRLLDATDMPPYTVTVDDFDAEYLPNGTPKHFRADVTWRTETDAAPRAERIEVNHPLTIGRDRVYLVDHGYALHFTVQDKDGNVLYQQWTPFQVSDSGSLLSRGVIKVPDVAPGFPQIGISGIFLPTFGYTEDMVPVSRFPAPLLPYFLFEAYAGDLGLDSGVPQNVYALDTSKLTRTGRGGLLPGDAYTHLAGGATLRFDGVKDYAVLQITRDPGKEIVLGAAVAMLVGLILSLRVRRRRAWVRAEPAGMGTLVTMGGLARQDPDAFEDEFAGLVAAVARDLPAAGDPAPGEPPPGEPPPADPEE